MTLMSTNKFQNILSLFLVIAVFNVSAGLTVLNAQPAPKPDVFGVLKTGRDASTTLNGNPVRDGATVRSGSQIKTGRDGAVVEIPKIGNVYLCPNTTAVITFSDRQISLDIASGEGKIAVQQMINGSIKTPDGKIVTSDSNNNYAAINSPGGADCSSKVGSAAATVAAAAAGGGLLGLGTAGTVGLLAVAGAVTAAGVTAARSGRRSNSISPFRP